MSMPANAAPTLSDRWSEYQFAREFCRMLAYGGCEFFIQPPQGEDDCGHFSIRLAAIDPAEMDKPPDDRLTTYTVYSYRLWMGGADPQEEGDDAEAQG